MTQCLLPALLHFFSCLIIQLDLFIVFLSQLQLKVCKQVAKFDQNLNFNFYNENEIIPANMFFNICFFFCIPKCCIYYLEIKVLSKKLLFKIMNSDIYLSLHQQYLKYFSFVINNHVYWNALNLHLGYTLEFLLIVAATQATCYIYIKQLPHTHTLIRDFIKMPFFGSPGSTMEEDEDPIYESQ